MIPAQDIADQMRFALDAENADHYGDAEDIVPAINGAINWLTSVINMTMGEKKLGEEIFRDLTISRVFRTSVDSRISLSSFPANHEVWTILALYPKPITGNTGAVFVPNANNKISEVDTSKYHISAENSCKRLTIEEWSINKKNPFAAGYELVPGCDELTLYAYLDPFDYNPDNNVIISKEIEIRPSVVDATVSPIVFNPVTAFYVKKPTPIATLADNIEFPHSVFNIIFNKALAYIAYKQGDSTNLNAITRQDIALLLRTIS